MKIDIVELSRRVGIRTIGKINGLTLFNDVTYEKLERLLQLNLEEVEKSILERIASSSIDESSPGLIKALEVIKEYKEIR